MKEKTNAKVIDQLEMKEPPPTSEGPPILIEQVHYWEDYWILPACYATGGVWFTSNREAVTCQKCLAFFSKEVGVENSDDTSGESV